MNIALLKYMDCYVRISKDPTHQVYKVAGINWDNEELLLLGDNGPFWSDHRFVDIVPEDSEDS